MYKVNKFLLTIFYLTIYQIAIPQNHAPIAINDTVEGYPGQTLEVNVLLNDYDPDGDTITIFYSGADSIKTVKIPIIYYDEMGEYKFSYAIIDQFGNFSPDSSRAFVVVKVQNESAAWLEINNVRALINSFGNQFHDPSNEGRGYFVPANTEISGFHLTRIWLTGMDGLSNIHASAEHSFTYDGEDFWAGPVATLYDSDYESRWYKIWNLTKEEIDHHKDNWDEPGYEPIPDIISWPGNGDITNGEAEQLAPYFDLDSDGVYEPLLGDHPKIKGDQCLFYILNDVNVHEATGGRNFGAEIHAMAYAFDCEKDSALNNTMFFSYRLFNRSDTTYHDCYFGFYTSWLLGNGWDNYSGCDTILHSYYCYNGDNYDDASYSGDTSWGYEYYPPALSVSFLNKTMTNYMRFGGMGIISFPYNDYQFHNYQKGVLLDSTHLTYGGWGYGGSQPTNYILSGDPLDTLSGWTELTAGNSPSWQNGLGSHGPFTFNPGDEMSFDFALVFGRDFTGNHLTSVNTMKERIETVRFYFENDSTPCGGSFSLGDPDYYSNIALSLYPNPVKDYAYIDGLNPDKDTRIIIYDIMGRCMHDNYYSSSRVKIPVSHLEHGLYIVLLINGNQVFTQKIIKQ